MALSPEFLDELRARTPMQAIVGRRVKLTKSGRNWKGCCPFHNEKSPSFYVYEDGFHCFGCGAHGDAVSFVMRISGAAFPEAVESLAAEAGLDVPKASPRAAQAERQRLGLHGVLDLAQTDFVRRLHSPSGAAGLVYLRGRGLSDATIARFGLGWSGDGRGELIAELRQAGIEPAQALAAGLLRETEEGELRELYWGRITFPIRDRRGRLISFGGRALGDAKPKYINGPDTAVFHKRQTLYALDLARAAVRSGQRMIVAEGYMDVIALHQAGFTGAVAPLGTALTAEQLGEIWRLSPEPLLCFDGDAAGARAAERAILLALPLLTPGYSLKLATLPADEDPDSLIKRHGPRAFEAVLAACQPFVEAAFATLASGVGDAPEQRAALRARLEASAKSIPDRILASEFRSAFLDRFFDARKRGGRGKIQPKPTRGAETSETIHAERARLLTQILLCHPSLLQDAEEAYMSLDLPPELARIREAILQVADQTALDSDSLVAHVKRSGATEEVSQVLSPHPPGANSAEPKAMPAEAAVEWWSIFGLMNRPRLQDEVAAAERAFISSPDANSQRRLMALVQALDALSIPEGDEEALVS